MPWGKFALDKLVRLYSVMAFYTLLCVLLHICGIVNLNFYTLFLNLITFQCIGVNNDFIGITWFISPFFWTMLLVFGMYKTFDNKYFHFFIAVLMYFSYVVLTKYGYGRETIGLGLNLAVVKMFAALITGYFIGMFHNKVKTANIFNEHKILTFMWFSIAEIISFVCIINWTLFHKISYTNNFIFMPIFVILIFCFVMNKGLLSQVTNIKLFEILGQYSYSIYVMQQIAFWLLKVYFWKNTDFLQNHFALTIVLSLIFTLILGIVTYYIIERPMIIWYKNLKFYDGGGG